MQTETITVAKIWPPNGKGPAAVVDSNNKKWKFWTTGKGGTGIPVERFVQGETYKVGFKLVPYNGTDEAYITVVEGGKSNVGAMPKPSFRHAANPGERRSIEIQSVAQRVPHWFAGVEPGDVEHLAEIINKIAKARDLSALGGTNAQKETDMEGDNIPY